MKYEVFGIKINKASLDEVVSQIFFFLKNKTKKIIFYVNTHSINISQTDISFKKVLNKADFSYCGGLGPVLAGKILNNISFTKTTTPDFIFKIFDFLEKNSKKVYFLGNNEKVLKKMILVLKNKYPRLIVCGYHDGFFQDKENLKIIKKINQSKPDLLLVGMGSPRQEKWIINNYQKIDAKVFWSVGALFEVLSGERRRLPKFFNDYGFEWIFRLMQEPRRLWRRYLIGNFSFLILILKKLIQKIFFMN